MIAKVVKHAYEARHKWKNARERLYATELSDVENQSLERYQYALRFCQDKDVLDSACGCGYGSNILSHKARSVLGVDYSHEAVGYARKFWGNKNTTFKQFDLNSDLTGLGNFDVIVSLETVEHLNTPIIETCQKFYKILRPGGLLIMSHPEKEIAPGNMAQENPSVKPSLNKAGAMNIKRAVYHLSHRNFSVFLDYIKVRISKKRQVISYHRHFNIDGESFKKDLIDIGFQIIDEWYQSGRFDYKYHLVVGEKKSGQKSSPILRNTATGTVK